ncbi:MAG: hypothetical protein OEZ19_00090 [Paracoccaceae bacterium]|nr:hypothetical protein [Paracoccaceae bacterium]
MSEADLDREPIELLQILTPKCANTYGLAPCTAAAGVGSECFNCRNTCQDVENYRDTPDRHLAPDLLLTNGGAIASGDITRTSDLFASFEVRFGSAPDGIIWEQGGSADFAAYLGVTSGNLVFRAGDGTVTSGVNAGKVSVDAMQFSGKSMTLYVGIDFVASGASTVSLWVFDPVELTLTLLGTDGFTASTAWAGTDAGAIGQLGGSNVATGESVASWGDGTIIARLYDATSAPSDMSDNFRKELWLGRGVKGEPTEDKYILPCLGDVGTISSRINLNAADDNYEPLGRRATLDFTAADFTHSDIGQDPYFATRLYDPRERSTFWRKWLIREKYGRVGALVRRWTGYRGQRLAEYRSQAFILDKVGYTEDGVSGHCRDILSKTEFRRAQIPEPSPGVLGLDVLAADTSFILAGDVTEEYPAAGTLRINDEIMTYTGRSAAGAPVMTTFTGVTRGTDGSAADDHDAGDLVQLCRRYTNDTITNALIEWLVDDSEIPAQYIDLVGIAEEDAAYLDAYTLTGLLTEPNGAGKLIGRLNEECSFYMWWDERAQKIRMQAIRAVDDNDVIADWSNEGNIIGDTLKLTEYPKQRLNVITFRYNPRDFAGDMEKSANFKNGLKLINGTTSLPEQYGNLVQTRDIYSIFLTTEAQANQTSSRLAIRYADVPQFAEFYVDAKDRAVWVGDIVKLDHPMLVSPQGVQRMRRWLVVEAEEVDPGHILRYVCADITLDGTIYKITENGIGDYTPELFDLDNAFITDNAGLNPDGTRGATIS